MDTGPLVALLNRRDRYHSWTRNVLDAIQPPLSTCEPVLTEAFFLLRQVGGGRDAILELLTKRIVICDFRVVAELSSIGSLMRKFADVPMSLANACLVRMTELSPRTQVLTLDDDFRIYRRNRRQLVPVITPN